MPYFKPGPSFGRECINVVIYCLLLS